jgi:ABC-type transporter Mla maintaining outer membrane lipid asymmetry permease subunit MlaE
VGRSTTSAVVTSIFLVVITDMIFTILFYVTSAATS